MCIHVQEPDSKPHLPSLRTFLGELRKVHRHIRSLALVFVTARLHEEGVRRRLAFGFIHVPFNHDDQLTEYKNFINVLLEITTLNTSTEATATQP